MKKGLCDCSFPRFKIIHTHGRKSIGYKVCKDCKRLLKTKRIIKRKNEMS